MKDRYHRHLKTITTELLINGKSRPNENMDKEVIFHPRENEKGREKYANISKQLVIGEIKKQVKVTRNSHTEWVKKKKAKQNSDSLESKQLYREPASLKYLW